MKSWNPYLLHMKQNTVFDQKNSSLLNQIHTENLIIRNKTSAGQVSRHSSQDLLASWPSMVSNSSIRMKIW